MSGAICDLPNEVLLAIIAHLDIGGILAFRQVGRALLCAVEGTTDQSSRHAG